MAHSVAGMDLRAEAVVAAPLSDVRAAVADLATYPHWLRIVLTATPEPGPAPAWAVEIGARLGPLRRAKRLRMVAASGPGDDVVFERAELDGRSHSPWVLRAAVSPEGGGDGTRLSMHLHYGGAAWLPLLEPVLAQEIRGAPGRLTQYIDRRRP